VKKYREGKLKSIFNFNLKRGEKNKNSLIRLAVDTCFFMLQCTFCIMGQRVDIFGKNRVRALFIVKTS